MDSRVKEVMEVEEEKQKVNRVLREKYRRVLKRNVLSFDCAGNDKVHTIHENQNMIQQTETSLKQQVQRMDMVGAQLLQRGRHTQEKMQKHRTDQYQHRVELLNQRIRILEAATKYVQQGKS